MSGGARRFLGPVPRRCPRCRWHSCKRRRQTKGTKGRMRTNHGSLAVGRGHGLYFARKTQLQPRATNHASVHSNISMNIKMELRKKNRIISASTGPNMANWQAAWGRAHVWKCFWEQFTRPYVMRRGTGFTAAADVLRSRAFER